MRALPRSRPMRSSARSLSREMGLPSVTARCASSSSRAWARSLAGSSVATGDAWLRAHIGGYANWAMSHDSLLIITWDEDDGSTDNQIPTIFSGQLVSPGRYSQLP